jgi:hypothetical protein
VGKARSVVEGKKYGKKKARRSVTRMITPIALIASQISLLVILHS